MLRARFIAIRRFSSSTSKHYTDEWPWWAQLATKHRGKLLFAGGFLFGGGGLSGAVLLKWNQDAAKPEDEDPVARKKRKLEEKLAAREDASTACSGMLQRWVHWPWWPPHWELVEAEVRAQLLLLRSASGHSASTNLADGRRCDAYPLGGAKVETLRQPTSDEPWQHEIRQPFPFFRLPPGLVWHRRCQPTPAVGCVRRRDTEAAHCVKQ